MLPAAYRRGSSNPSPRGAMMRRVPPQKESVTTKIQRNQHNQASRAAARERAAKVFVERSVAAAPNPVSPEALAEMKKELEQAGSDLVVPRAHEEEGFQLAVEKA